MSNRSYGDSSRSFEAMDSVPCWSPIREVSRLTSNVAVPPFARIGLVESGVDRINPVGTVIDEMSRSMSPSLVSRSVRLTVVPLRCVPKSIVSP